MNVLDITHQKQTGKDLADLINSEMKATQSVLVQPYPSELLMTRNQYNELMLMSSLDPMDESDEDRMFVTDEGFVLEVRVK